MMVSAVGITSEGLWASPYSERRSRGGLPAASCLVVTGDAALRSRLRMVAEMTDWNVCVAPADADGIRSAADKEYDLVIVDIAHPCGDRVTDSVELAEDFARRPGTLLAVCSSGESLDEELWARQLGVWAYLPEMATGDALVSLFHEAGRSSARWMAQLSRSGVRQMALAEV